MSINRRDFDMKEIKTVVKEIMDAPSCYPALREAAQDYLAKQAQEVRAKGGKYCFCPACTAGVELLDRKAELL